MGDENEKIPGLGGINPLIKRSVIALLLMSLLSASVLFASHIRLAREAAYFEELAATISAAPPVSETVPVSIAVPVNPDDDKTAESAENAILAKYTALYEQNHDLIGWLTIDSTKIDYPVMYTPSDEEYYINRDFGGKSSSSGTLFANSENTFEPDGIMSDNVIIYGHNMKNGTMFGALMDYKDESFYKEHTVIRFDTIYEQAEYEIIAVFFSQVYNKNDDVFKFYNFINAEDESDFNTYVDNIRHLSIYNCAAAAVYGDELITLVTCAYHVENGRFVVVAKKITGYGS